MPEPGDRITKRKDGRYMARYTVQTPDGPKRKTIYGKALGRHSFRHAVGTRLYCRRSPGRTGRFSRAETFAASARALSSSAARTFSGSILPSEESSTHRPKGDPPSVGTLTALHRSASRRRVLRS